MTCYLEEITSHLNISPFRAGHTKTLLFRASLNSASAADLIFHYDSWPTLEAYEATIYREYTIFMFTHEYREEKWDFP